MGSAIGLGPELLFSVPGEARSSDPLSPPAGSMRAVADRPSRGLPSAWGQSFCFLSQEKPEALTPYPRQPVLESRSPPASAVGTLAPFFFEPASAGDRQGLARVSDALPPAEAGLDHLKIGRAHV